jgi:hypothetical protein
MSHLAPLCIVYVCVDGAGQVEECRSSGPTGELEREVVVEQVVVDSCNSDPVDLLTLTLLTLTLLTLTLLTF